MMTTTDTPTPPKTKRLRATKVREALGQHGLLPEDPQSTGATPKPIAGTHDVNNPRSPPNQQKTPGRCAGCSKPIYAHAEDCVVLKARPGEEPDPGPARVYRSVLGAFAILLGCENKVVTYLALTSSPLVVATMPLSTFNDSWKPVEGYPVKRAAKLLIGYAQDLGAYQDALEALQRLTNLQPMEKEQAVNTQTAAAVKQKPAAPKKDTKKEPAKGKPAKDIKAAAKAAGEKKDRQPTAASRFRELILEGGKTCKHTDDEIFATVKKEFKLDDSKRSYVAWYRNDLKKRGETVPAPKEAKEAKA